MFDYVGKATKIELPTCKFCGSRDTVKNGHRKGTQYYICKNCGKGFVDNKGLPRMRYPMDVVAKGVYDYYAGTSLTKIREGIAQQWNLYPADSAVYTWLRMLTKKAIAEAKKYPISVGDKWVCDETVVSLSGEKYWYIDIIDADTRFLLAAKISPNRTIKDIKATFEEAKEKAGKSPSEILSDGWAGYPDAVEQVFGADTKHAVGSPFKQDDLNTNLIERWHGTLKDRLKPMRGMDRSKVMQLVLDGFIFYYNYFRPHEGLEGETPGEAAKVKFPFRSWFDVAESLRPKPEPLPRDK
ncbi:MAG: IS1/IS6 family transposase [Chloroflexi bacterium]|nr:IS1/IS6 family transposase [Chloroflexota bacterium]